MLLSINALMVALGPLKSDQETGQRQGNRICPGVVCVKHRGKNILLSYLPGLVVPLKAPRVAAAVPEEIQMR